MNFVDDTQVLMHLGLTNSQAKVYLALLRLGTDNKGTTIAKFADVLRQDVYRLLDELQQIGIAKNTLQTRNLQKRSTRRNRIYSSRKKND
jgi:sugar-specific transcriptional regulator TrmB